MADFEWRLPPRLKSIMAITKIFSYKGSLKQNYLFLLSISKTFSKIAITHL